MSLNEAIEKACGLFITNGIITFCVIDKKFYGITMNQICITDTDQLFIRNWRLA